MLRYPFVQRGPSHRLVKTRTKALLAAIVAAAPLCMPSTASADRSWLGSSGLWSDFAWWSGGQVPGANDNVFITNADIVNRQITQNAGAVNILNLTIDNAVGLGTNAVLLSGSNHSISANTQSVGCNGKGEFINNGAYNFLSSSTFNNGGLLLGVGTMGRGLYTLTNDGKLLVQGPNTRSIIGDAGFATFNHASGNATFTTLTMGAQLGGVGSYTLGATARLNVGTTSIFTIGESGAGTFIHNNGGNAQITKLSIGASQTGRGLYLMNGGNLTINGAAQFDSAEFNIGMSGNGTFVHSAGSVTYDSPLVGSAGLNIGINAGGAGTYLLSGNSVLNSNNNGIYVGRSGAGHFLQTGATVNAHSIIIGQGGDGRYELGGNGVINIKDALSVSSGTMTHRSGTLTIGNSNPLLGTISFGQMSVGGLYRFESGSLNVNGAEIIAALGGNGTATLNQTAGVHKLNGIMFIGDINGLFPGTTGTYLLSGGRLEVTPDVVAIGANFRDDTLNGLQLDTGGTIVGGATDGVFAGKMTQRGGTIGGTFRNDGHIVSKGGSVSGQLLNRNRLSMNGGTLTVGSIAINNDAVARIDGAGTINGAVDNFGHIEPTGALAIGTINNTTEATIDINAGTSLRPTMIDNHNTIRLNGGSLAGTSGQILNNANFANGGALISGGGVIEPTVFMDGGIVRADLPGVPLVLKGVAVTDPSSQFIVAPSSTLNLQPSFVNSAPISIGGNGARLIGGTISNHATIKGSGQIGNRVLNFGVIRPEGGELMLTASNSSNAAGGLIQVGAGNAINFSSGLPSNSGQIQLTGGDFNTNSAVALNNNGGIVGRGTIRAGTINNTGSMHFSGGLSDVFTNINNTGKVTVTGNANATFYGNVNNSGTGSVSVTLGSTAVFMGTVNGLSTINGPGVKDFESVASAGAINATGTTIIGPAGDVTAASVRENTVDLHGRLTIAPNGSSTAASVVSTLRINGDAAPTGTLNLNNNDLIVKNGDRQLVESQIAFARNGGAWNQPGISSGTAANASPRNTTLGVLSGQQYRAIHGAGATFDGLAVADSHVLVKYTYYGDTDLNGIVNFDDYSRLDNGFNNRLTGWLNGDFDFSGSVNFDDYALIDLAFNTQGAAHLAAVPEPTSAVLPCVLTGLAATRRRRRSRGASC